MNRIFLTYLLSVLPFLGGSLYAQNVSSSRGNSTQLSDTLEVEDNPWAIEHDSLRVPTDSARLRGDIDNIIYVMDRRHLYEGDDTLRHWYDNLFFQVGMGVDKMLLQTDDYTFHQFTNLHAALGVQLNKYHSLRGVLEGAYGFRKYQSNLMIRGEAKLDHLFDLTSYFDGYRPNRLLSISSVIGGGLMYSVYHPKSSSGSKRKGLGAEIHGGVQFRFYTGPHGYLNFEPYIGVGPDRIDLSYTSWRKLDVFYGANLNYVYYFTNHLSRAARMRLLAEMDERQKLDFITIDEQTNDTLLQSWAAPWFFEFSAGPAALVKDYMDVKTNLEHMGHNISMSVGKWFSPVIGMRGTLSERMAIYRVDGYNRFYLKEHGNHYISARLDGLFNPFGFSKNFDWNARYGCYFMMGFELGWISFTQFYSTKHELRTYSQAYSLAAHGWVKISDGLQFFVEPRLVGHTYKIPYKNVDWQHVYTRKAFMVNFGFTATGLSPKYRKPLTVADSTAIDNSHWTVGIAGGTNLIQKYTRLIDDDGFPYNFNVFAQYHINKVSGVRLGFEYMVHGASAYSRYRKLTLTGTTWNKSGVYSDMWNHSHRIGFFSIDYSVNLTNLLFGYKPGRKFDIEAFAGPSLAIYFDDKAELSQKVGLMDNQVAELAEEIEKKNSIAANGGVKVSYQLTDQLGFYVSPQLFCAPQLKLKGVDMTNAKLFETLDLGVQYKF